MAKKDFKINPAMSFISQETIDKVDGSEGKAPAPTGSKKIPEGYKINPEFIETKSKRVQLLMQPSLHKDAKAISDQLGISLNDFIHRAIQEATYNQYVTERITKDVEEK